MSTKLEDLKPAVMVAALKALHELKAEGVQVVVTYTFRTLEEQAALYAQGRKSLAEVNRLRAIANLPAIMEYLGKDKKIHSDNDYTVTNCDGIQISKGGKGRSPHQTGTALDVVPDVDASEKVVPGWPAPSDPRWKVIAAAFKRNGFEWGGDWTKKRDGIDPDYPHYQYKEVMA